MRRFDAIKLIMEQVRGELVISNIGDPSKELYHIRDRPENFYMLGSLGQASSISLGLALSQREKVICLDGDGSLLSNLGSFATIANQNPSNLVLIALDNGSYGTTGYQKSYTAGKTNLKSVAKACGFKKCYMAENEIQLARIIGKSLKSDDLCFIQVRVDTNNEKVSNIPLDPVSIKKRIMGSIQEKTFCKPRSTHFPKISFPRSRSPLVS